MLERLAEAKIVPALRDTDVSEGIALIGSLVNRGYRAVNISQQSPHGLAVLTEAVKRFPSVLCGAGNVKTAHACELAVNAGAQFILSPLFDPEMVRLAQSKGVLILPVLTDGDIASSYHLSAVSLYPVASLGGTRTVESLMDRYGIRSLIAGSLNDESLEAYRSLEGFLAATGSWMITD